MRINQQNIGKYFLLSIVIFLLSCSGHKEKDQEVKKPNFLFILVDDQPFDALQSEARYRFLETPNMQRLEDEGVKFTNYFCTVSLCSPSRASILSGTYPHIHGVNQNHPKVDPDWETFKSYPNILHEAGYETAFIGKMHMAHKHGEEQPRPGYDYWLGFSGQGRYFDPELNENGREFTEKGYITDILTEKTVQWLINGRDKNKPFSLNLWHKAVHEPYRPAPRHDSLYHSDSLPVPPYDTASETFKGKPEWQRIKQMDSAWKEYEPKDDMPVKEWDPNNKRFMSLLKTLKAVDESIGKVLKTLAEIGELDNTVIIYSSDNGYFMGEHTYWDKRIAYDPSMRIPLLIRYPKMINPQSKIDELCLNIDLAPTILEIAGVPIPKKMQGRSMMNLLKKKEPVPDWRNAILFEYYVDDVYPYAGPNMIAIRTDSLKYVDNFIEDDIDELYDLKNDPGEMKNLIKNPEYVEELDYMKRLEAELKKEYKYNPERDWWLDQVINNEAED